MTYRNRLTLHFLHDVSLGDVTVGNFILFEDGPVVWISEKRLVMTSAAFERFDRLLPHQMLNFLVKRLKKTHISPVFVGEALLTPQGCFSLFSKSVKKIYLMRWL